MSIAVGSAGSRTECSSSPVRIITPRAKGFPSPVKHTYYRAKQKGIQLTQAAYDCFMAIFSDGRPKGIIIASDDNSATRGTVTVRTRDDLEVRKSARRLPNAEELQKLLSNANPKFAAFYEFWSQSNLSFDTAANLEISDFDWIHQRVAAHRITGENPSLAFQSLALAIQQNPKLWRLIERAAGDQQVGPVFRTGVGTAWAIDTARVYFNRARKKAQISKEVVMQGHRRLGQ